MAFNFLPYDQDQLFLLPPSLQEWVPEGSLARFISSTVDALEARGKLEGFYQAYRADGWGGAAYHPRMLVKVLLYGYALGVRSSRKIAEALERDVAFRYLAGNQQPDFRTISDFRKQHLNALEALFTTVLEVCAEAGLVKLGAVALDGRKVAGNAAVDRSLRKAELEKMAKRLLEAAAKEDAGEDDLFGREQRGDELPEGLGTETEQLKRIRAALAELEREEEKIRGKQAEKIREREEKRARGEEVKGPEPKAETATMRKKIEKLRANTTDPDSRIQKTRKGWIQGYNGQAMVDCHSQVIVAQALTNEADDAGHLELMLERCEEQAGRRPRLCTADAGYSSEANAQLEDRTTKLLIAVDRERKVLGREKGEEEGKRLSTGLPEAERMRRRLKTKTGRKLYKLRGQTVEPVFGQMAMRDLNRFLLRGLSKVQAEWSLFCTTHNLLKLWRTGWRPAAA